MAANSGNAQWFADLDAVALADMVRSRQVSPVAAVEAALERIADWDGAVNACCAVLEDEARAAAQAAEREVLEGHDVGPLHGVPMVVKDAIWLRGVPATMGSRALADFVPQDDAVPVARLRAAGAIVVAKTTNPELLWEGDTQSVLQGVTRNPWRLDRNPGGSSGGSAVAVATGMAPLALGTDAGGSIRNPAAACGIVGHKPSFGLVPRGPCFEECRTTNVVGPMTRSVRDAVLALSIMSGTDPHDDLSLPIDGMDLVSAVEAVDGRALRVAWTADLGGLVDVGPGRRAAFMQAIERLSADGWQLQEACPEAGDPLEIAYPVWLAEIAHLAPGREALLEEPARKLIEDARALSAHEYYAAQLARGRFSAAWETFLTDFDVLLAPSEPPSPRGEATAVDGVTATGKINAVANLTRMPGVSVPTGFDAEGLPCGLEVIAPRGEDAHCLAVAAALERLQPWPRVASMPSDRDRAGR
jgi:Asp-tRNA(Asn)/Glu-tRNA(Gln) amidotransferase A subunit family amidase